jgi:hypothetical protein
VSSVKKTGSEKSLQGSPEKSQGEPPIKAADAADKARVAQLVLPPVKISSDNLEEPSCASVKVKEEETPDVVKSEEDEDAPALILTFPQRLMELLDEEGNKDSLWWFEDGKGFCVVPKLFASSVLTKFFQGTKFESFTRKLNRWGFKRAAGQHIPADAIAYFHDSFRRGQPELLKEMSGGKKKDPKTNLQDKMLANQLNRDVQIMAAAGLPVGMQPDAHGSSHMNNFSGLAGLGLSNMHGLGMQPDAHGSQMANFSGLAGLGGLSNMNGNSFGGGFGHNAGGGLDQQVLLQALLQEHQRKNELIRQQQAQLYAVGMRGDKSQQMSPELLRRLMALNGLQR